MHGEPGQSNTLLAAALLLERFNLQYDTLHPHNPDGRTRRQIVAIDAPGGIINADNSVIVDDRFSEGKGTSRRIVRHAGSGWVDR